MNAPFAPPLLAPLVAIGDGAGIVLTAAMLDRLGVRAGEGIDIVETEAGFELRRHLPDFDEKMRAANAIMDEDSAILSVLAK